MENKNNEEVNLITSAQEILIKKILKSGKILDKEYRQLRIVLDNQVITSYDASVFIEYVLGILKFRRTFFNGKHKAYKKCYYCNSRENVQRMLHLETDRKFWVCSTCVINLDPAKFVPVKIAEEQEAKADLYKKYEYPELTSAQEDLIHEHREG